jgi:hypothetical protein
MAALRTRKRVLASKIEAVYATDPVPTSGANGILVKNLQVMPVESELQSRDNVKAFFGNDEQILAAVYRKVSFEVELAGPGATGSAPAFGPLLRACGMSETILAVAHTDTATAGSASSITLAVTASAVDNAYAGLTIRTTGGTGAGQSAVIKSYVGATKVATLTANLTTPPDATTVYSIDAQVVYRRITDSLESITHYVNKDGVLYKLTGARGTVSFAWPYKKIATMKFQFTGLFSPVTDVALVAPTLTGFTKPVAVNNINTTGIVVMGYTGAVMSDLNIDLANQVTFRSLPGGSESVEIVDSKPTGSITIEATKQATKDWWDMIKTVTTGPLSMKHGQTAGNIVKIDAPKVQMTQPSESDLDGIEMMGANLTLIPDLGNDELTLCFM